MDYEAAPADVPPADEAGFETAVPATAIAPTRLLSLSQQDFYALLSERVEITHGVNRVLCEWIRRLSAAAPVS
jgi:hypothetical protein